VTCVTLLKSERVHTAYVGEAARFAWSPRFVLADPVPSRPLTSPDTRAGATPETMKEGAAVHPGARPLPSPTNDHRSLLCRCRKGEIKAKRDREGGVTLIQRSAGVAGHRLLVCGRGQCSQLPRDAASRTRAVGSGFANFLDCAESQDHCRRSCSRHSSRCVSMLEMARAGWAPC
jgi:hypothetical protein